MMRARQKERQRRLLVARKLAERRKFLLDLVLIGTMIISGMMFLGFIVTSVMGS